MTGSIRVEEGDEGDGGFWGTGQFWTHHIRQQHDILIKSKQCVFLLLIFFSVCMEFPNILDFECWNSNQPDGTPMAVIESANLIFSFNNKQKISKHIIKTNTIYWPFNSYSIHEYTYDQPGLYLLLQNVQHRSTYINVLEMWLLFLKVQKQNLFHFVFIYNQNVSHQPTYNYQLFNLKHHSKRNTKYADI